MLVRGMPCVQGAAGVGMGGGLVADWLHGTRGWSLADVRRLMQAVASFGDTPRVKQPTRLIV